MYKADELRKKYLDFFKTKGHTIILSSSLIPENDPTVLFTTAGMHPLVPYLMGESHPGGNKVANVQKCIRTTDINEVGNATHHTFFEMLGNWSFGSYFKKEAIEWSWEFLTSPNWLGLDKNRLAVSVFKGDEDAPFDEESFNKWEEIGMPKEKIAKLPKKNNWWGPAGETGPCGPDTEMFYWIGDSDKVPNGFNDDNDLWVEIWNDVFMQFEKTKDGKFIPLKQKNVDTGMGLERMLVVINGLDDNYKTELFLPIVEEIEKISGKKYEESEETKKSMRIIADHTKASVMIMGDDKGISPSNTGQGYVLRRLIRRAVRYGKVLEINQLFLNKIVSSIIEIYKNQYPEILRNKNFIEEQISIEEEKFTKTLRQGEQIFNKMIGNGHISGKDAFVLFSTYGFPFELTKELADSKGYEINESEFKSEMEKHAELSKTASAGMFKGGLADSGEDTKKLHTAAHLMLESLRRVLGDHVSQKGSNITSERLRFDFSHPEKLTAEQIKKVEDMVNEQIDKRLPVSFEEMTLTSARELGATGVFDSKYGEKVKVYSVGAGDNFFSKEICGGPHVDNTGLIGKFKIIKEESSSTGVRRIKAVVR